MEEGKRILFQLRETCRVRIQSGLPVGSGAQETSIRLSGHTHTVPSGQEAKGTLESSTCGGGKVIWLTFCSPLPWTSFPSVLGNSCLWHPGSVSRDGGELVLPTSTTWERACTQLISAESLRQPSLCGPGCVVGHVWAPAPGVCYFPASLPCEGCFTSLSQCHLL